MGRAGRRPGRARPAGPRRADRPALAARRRRSSSRRRSAARPAGYAGLFDPAARPGRDRLLRRRRRRPPRGGPRLVQRRLLADRWANEAFASYYGLEVARPSSRSRRAPTTLTPELEAARIPLNAWGPVGREDDDDRGLRATRRRSPSPARSPSGPATTACARSGPTPPARVGAYQPARPVTTARRRRGARDRRRTARLARPARPARGADRRRPTTTCGGPGSRATPTCRCSTRGRRPGREYDEVVAAAGDWQLPRPVRDAMRAWRFEPGARRCSTTPRRSSTSARRSRRPRPRPG